MFGKLFTSTLFSICCLYSLSTAQEPTAAPENALHATDNTLPQEAVAAAEGGHVIPLDIEKIEQDVRAKEQIIDSLNLPDNTRKALLKASGATSVQGMKEYLQAKHHAYDGHSVLEHARQKVDFRPPMNLWPCPDCGETTLNIDPDGPFPAWTHHYTNGATQYSRFPIPLKVYASAEKDMGLWDKLRHRVDVDPFNLAATLIFLLAILHTFIAPKFQQLAHHLEQAHRQKLKEEKFRILHPEQRMPVSFTSTLCHFLGEVEVVFGLWIIPFAIICNHYYSMEDFLFYIDRDTSFTEPLFVAVVMVIASSRPIYRLAENTLKFGASIGKGTPAAWWLSVLCQ